LLIGGIHAIPDLGNGATQADTERLFLRDTERLLAHPIQVLAHPFRFFRRSKLQTPQHLYRPVARMLAARGVAAEINYHTNATDARFIEECVACGVKVALGTDSHDLAEVGELAPHLAVLRQAGVRPEDFPTVLYAPP
jgi:histidinol phosphatase-like PHP family hydrolase